MEEQQINNWWQEQQDICRQIYNKGFRRYFGRNVNYHNVYDIEEKAIKCIDEGVPGGIHLAGSGILLSLEDAGRIIHEIGHVDGLYSHENCDVAVLHAKLENIDEDPDEVGKRHVKELAAELDLSYLGHISSDDMNRPSNFHTARAIYYDGTGQFDYSKSENLPKGFIVSRRYLYKDYAQYELDISIDIAFGNSGFADRFNKDNPLIVVALAENKEALDQLNREINEVVAEYDKERFTIYGMVK